MRQENVKALSMFRGSVQVIDFPVKHDGYSGVRYLPHGGYEE
ncbi:hypothetical protein [Pseudomonas inefficax]